jgi:hypothetical protein
MRGFGIILLATAAMGQAGSAATQQAAAPSVPVVTEFSRCIASEEPRVATKMLTYPLSGPEQSAALRRAVDDLDHCLNYDITSSRISAPETLMLISGMAEELFRAGYGGRNVATLVETSAAKPRNINEDVALCVVRSNPMAARELIDTAPGSEGEKAVIAKIAPQLGSCVPQGQTLAVNRITVRAWVATGLYLAARSGGSATASS